MKYKNIKIFSVCIILVFVFSLVFFGVSLLKNINNGKLIASESLETVISDTTLFVNNYGLTDEFVQKYTDYVKNNKNIAAIIITHDGSTCFAYPVSSPLIKIDNFGDPVLEGNSPIISIFSSTLPTNNYTNVAVTTSVYLIHPNKIFDLAKTTFLIILSATILVFIVLIIQYKNMNEEKESEKLNNTEILTKHTYDETNQIESCNVADDTKKEIFQQNEVKEDNIIEEKTVSPDYKPLASNISDPQGLFSEFTGLGWESYFETRLDSELARTASAEQDLSLFLIRIEDITFKNHIIPYLTSILLDKFKFRDLIFEYGTNGFAAIVPGMDLDRAMALSQDLYTDVSGLLINKQMNNKIGIGITTRSLRLITGNRLIEEATQALEKAFEEQGLPIVAFRVSPEKYRQCLIDEG